MTGVWEMYTTGGELGIKVVLAARENPGLKENRRVRKITGVVKKPRRRENGGWKVSPETVSSSRRGKNASEALPVGGVPRRKGNKQSAQENAKALRIHRHSRGGPAQETENVGCCSLQKNRKMARSGWAET